MYRIFVLFSAMVLAVSSASASSASPSVNGSHVYLVDVPDITSPNFSKLVALATALDSAADGKPLQPNMLNRQLLQDYVNTLLAIGAEAAGLEPSDAPTLNGLMKQVYMAHMSEKAPIDLVAAFLRRDKALRAEKKAAPSGPTYNYAAALLLPYLQDAGLCGGEPWTAQGMTCTYSDSNDPAVRVAGKAGDLEVKAAPEGSELALIFELANSNAELPIPTIKLENKSRGQLDWLSFLGIGSAEAITIDLGGAITVALPDDVEDCFRVVPTEAQVLTARLDPWEFGMVVWNETLNRIDVVARESAQGKEIKILLEQVTRNAVRYVKELVSDTITDKSNAKADRVAKRACRGYRDEKYKQCYLDHYREQVKIAEGMTPLLGILMDYLVAQTNAVWSNGFDTSTTGLLGAAAGAAAGTFMRVDIYGEAYVLNKIEYPTLNADQVFVLFPFAFTCAAHECGRIGHCGIHLEDSLACAERYGELREFEIRDAGGYIEHSINTCSTQVQPYSSRPPYQSIRANEATTGESGLEQNVTIQTSYQVPGEEHPEPNECDAQDETDDVGIDDVNDTSNQRVEHLCPYPTSQEGPADLPPRWGAQVPDLIGMQPAQEQIPYWRWQLSQVNTRSGDYSAIYAGLSSTHTEYTTKRDNVPNAELIYPNCSTTREFNGVESDEGHAFWAWHGKSSEAPVPSAETIGTMVGLSAYIYTDVDYTSYYYLLGASAALGVAHPVDNTYECDDLPFTYSPFCGDDELNLGAANDGHWPMPETNIILAQTLHYDEIEDANTCESQDDGGGTPRVVGLGGASVEGQPTDDEPQTFKFDIERRGNPDTEFSLDYETVAGSARPNFDFEPVSGTLHFEPGEMRKTVEVELIGDNIIEPAETYSLMLSNANGAEIVDPELQGEIVDDDTPRPQNTRSFVIVTGPDPRPEGTGDAESADFVIQRSGNLESTVTVRYNTTLGTAYPFTDYEHVAGTLTFAPGETEAMISVPIYGDNIKEDDEYFSLQAYRNSGDVQVVSNNSVAYLLNDDEQFSISVEDAILAEPSSGEAPMLFRLVREGDTNSRLDVTVRTISGTAEQGVDFEGKASEIYTFMAGQNEISVPVNIYADTRVEEDETFSLQVSYVDRELFFSYGSATVTGVGRIENTASSSALIATDDYEKTEVNTPITPNVVDNDSSATGQAPTVIAIITPPEHGVAIQRSSSTIEYTPNSGYQGPDSLEYRITDATGATADAILHIEVVSAPAELEAIDDGTSTQSNQSLPIPVLANDKEGAGGLPYVKSVDKPAHGDVSFSGSRVYYTPDWDFTGEDMFSYTIADESGAESTATISVSVHGSCTP